MSILRIELRRSIAPWAGLALVVVALGFLFLFSGPWWKTPAPWTAHTTTTALWVRFLLVFLLPIVFGAGAVQGMRDSRSGITELLATMSRPGWHRAVKLAGAVGSLSALGFLLVFAVGVVEVLAHGGFVSASFVPLIVVGTLGVVAASWVGLAVGRLLPHPLTAPALAVAALAVTVTLWTSLNVNMDTVVANRFGFLSPALAEPRGTLVTIPVSIDVGQAVWFLGLAVTGFLLLAAKSVRARLLGLLPMAAGAAIALPLFPAVVDGDLTADGIASQMLCDGPVCVSRLHEERLAGLMAPGREALGMLAKLPGAPTRIEEQTAPGSITDPPPRDPHIVYLDLQRNDVLLTASADDLRLAVLAGAGTPTCDRLSTGSLADEVARMISAAWFTGELKQLPEFARYWTRSRLGEIETMWREFRALPPDVQRIRISAMRQVLLTCQGDPLDVLLPGALR